MAITVYGVERNLDLKQWARVQDAQSKAAPMPAAVISGGAVTTSGRVATIAAGKAVIPGCLVEWDATTLTHDATPSGRLDVLTLQVVWGDGAVGSAATAGSFFAVKGAAGSGESGVAPTLTRDPGVKYQLPLKTYLVTTGLDDQGGEWGYAGSAWTATTPAGNWSRPASNGLMVKRKTNATVLATGRLIREAGAGTITVGNESAISGLRLIPAGFIPGREVNTYAMWDVGTATPGMARIRIDDRGFGFITPLTKNLVAGNNIVILDTTWETN